MKKKNRHSRTPETLPQTDRVTGAEEISDKKRLSRNRGRPRKTDATTKDSFCYDNAVTDETVYSDFSMTTLDDGQTHPENVSRSTGRLTAAVCRLCHGKFSPRSLRHAFNKWPQESMEIIGEPGAASQPPLLFHTDFQRLVGVQMDRDPQLSEFICKKCHTKFYKCHSILIRFLQRVNIPPVEKENIRSRKNAKCPESSMNLTSRTPPSFTSDPEGLHSLVSWVHHHGEACHSCPNLTEVLEGQCWGSVKAVWGCVDGHSYIMDTQCTPSHLGHTVNFGSGELRSDSVDGVMSEEEMEQDDEEDEQQLVENVETSAGMIGTVVQRSLPAVTVQTQSSALDEWTGSSEDIAHHEETVCPGPAQLEDRAAVGELSYRVISEDEESRRGSLSDEELFESDERGHSVNFPNKRRQSLKSPEEPRIRKKPGPKPGWKNNFKPKGCIIEELPSIYKCPYQGCTAVYRAPDGLKKHIKEHHEDMRERPCPHPGCNKVFMIDRYLQRHIKLIHTEERNYICDQCGQTFKQRKHLSVHQMRHSGAKPLQCEVCGFQCRQRASLKYHMTKHKAEADLEFECLRCRKRFEKAHNLNVHMSMVHPLIQAEAQSGGGSSSQQQYKDLHTITLTGEVIQHDQDR